MIVVHFVVGRDCGIAGCCWTKSATDRPDCDCVSVFGMWTWYVVRWKMFAVYVVQLFFFLFKKMFAVYVVQLFFFLFMIWFVQGGSTSVVHGVCARQVAFFCWFVHILFVLGEVLRGEWEGAMCCLHMLGCYTSFVDKRVLYMVHRMVLQVVCTQWAAVFVSGRVISVVCTQECATFHFTWQGAINQL